MGPLRTPSTIHSNCIAQWFHHSPSPETSHPLTQGLTSPRKSTPRDARPREKSHTLCYHTPYDVTPREMLHPAGCHTPRDNHQPRHAIDPEMSHLSPPEMSHPHSRSHIPRDVTPREMSHPAGCHTPRDVTLL